MVQHSQLKRRGQAQYQKFNMGHCNIPMQDLAHLHRLPRLHRKLRPTQHTVLNPDQNPKQKVTRDCWDENWCGTFIKTLLNLRNALTGLKELANFSDLGYLPQKKVNQGARDNMLCYNQVMFITFIHTSKECNRSVCYLPGMLLYVISVIWSKAVGNDVMTAVSQGLHHRLAICKCSVHTHMKHDSVRELIVN